MPSVPFADVLGLFLTPWGLGILGLCVGSFLNVVVHRLPKMLEARWQADAADVLGPRWAWAAPLLRRLARRWIAAGFGCDASLRREVG